MGVILIIHFVQVPESAVLPSEQMAAGGHLLDASPAVQSQALGCPSWGTGAAAAGESLLKRTPLSAQRRQPAVLVHRPSAQPFPPLADVTNTTGDLMGPSAGAVPLFTHFLSVDLVLCVPAPKFPIQPRPPLPCAPAGEPMCVHVRGVGGRGGRSPAVARSHLQWNNTLLTL